MVLHTADLAEAFGVVEGTIRKWETEGTLPPAARMKPTSRRKWSAATIAPILQAKGLPVPASWGVAAVAVAA